MVHSCCNYDGGNCLALDDGEACRCSKHFLFGTLQMVSAAILPTDKKLEAALYYRLGAKHCAACIALFLPGSNRAKFCPSCAANRKWTQAAERKRKQRRKCQALGAETPCKSSTFPKGSKMGGRDCNITMFIIIRITDWSGKGGEERETQTDILERLLAYCWIFVYI